MQEKLRLFYLIMSIPYPGLNWIFIHREIGQVDFLANRVKAFQAISTIYFLTSPSGDKIHDPYSIANSFAEYYSELYNLTY